MCSNFQQPFVMILRKLLVLSCWGMRWIGARCTKMPWCGISFRDMGFFGQALLAKEARDCRWCPPRCSRGEARAELTSPSSGCHFPALSTHRCRKALPGKFVPRRRWQDRLAMPLTGGAPEKVRAASAMARPSCCVSRLNVWRR